MVMKYTATVNGRIYEVEIERTDVFRPLTREEIAAGAVVPANQVLEPGIYAGIPAKKIKDGSEAIQAKAHANAQNYLLYKTWYE